MTRTHITGGAKAKTTLNRMIQAQQNGVKKIEIGFFASARYPPVTTGRNGGRKQKPHPVAYIAAINEFGTKDGHIPERPFFRKAVAAAPAVLKPLLAASVDAEEPAITRHTADLLGQAMTELIQIEITRLRTPVNADATILRKQSSNPLLDTGFLRQTVTHRVDGVET